MQCRTDNGTYGFSCAGIGIDNLGIYTDCKNAGLLAKSVRSPATTEQHSLKAVRKLAENTRCSFSTAVWRKYEDDFEMRCWVGVFFFQSIQVSQRFYSFCSRLAGLSVTEPMGDGQIFPPG
jgi:hypothetical protein